MDYWPKLRMDRIKGEGTLCKYVFWIFSGYSNAWHSGWPNEQHPGLSHTSVLPRTAQVDTRELAETCQSWATQTSSEFFAFKTHGKKKHNDQTNCSSSGQTKLGSAQLQGPKLTHTSTSQRNAHSLEMLSLGSSWNTHHASFSQPPPPAAVKEKMPD